MPSVHTRARDALHAHALSLPEAYEDHPWGELVIKVGKKIFVFLGLLDGKHLSLSVKLPDSGAMALTLPFAAPTGYGLGKAGWVSARFTETSPPVEMLREWIVESYHAVAPKKLSARVATESSSSPPAKPKKTSKKKATTTARGAKAGAKKAAKKSAKRS